MSRCPDVRFVPYPLANSMIATARTPVRTRPFCHVGWLAALTVRRPPTMNLKRGFVLRIYMLQKKLCLPPPDVRICMIGAKLEVQLFTDPYANIAPATTVGRAYQFLSGVSYIATSHTENPKHSLDGSDHTRLLLYARKLCLPSRSYCSQQKVPWLTEPRIHFRLVSRHPS